MDAAKLAVALRDVERAKIILDRSVIVCKSIHGGSSVQFDGYKVQMMDAFKLIEHVEHIEKFLRELANEN